MATRSERALAANSAFSTRRPEPTWSGSLLDYAVFFKYLHRFFNRQSLDRVSVAGHGRRLKQRVVDGLLRRFDRGLKKGRHRVVGHHFQLPRQRLVIGVNPYLRRGRECDGIVSTAV